eukprot:CAMPEP_0181042810 /NCGR_PEP_ID=MMETSP1070-20121207/12357_1 /TAXON_ID=265543 /ORGANISM="Minutocellus polymorphus, Strain NH13" /LENGTH=376 /DNA_ID=CAMNT_0023121065 /DNA_START=238 /DNA_END=1368 /DNA_ORIENTATION=-
MSSSEISEFKAKVAFMKTWRPQSAVSNRDKMEIYALHKQAVSGDAPQRDPPNLSVSERTNLREWRKKRGLTQAEAKAAYISECDRQIRTYGTAPQSAAANGGGGGGGSTADGRGGSGRSGNQTPTNTPATPAGRSPGGGPLLTPRGIAAIPLLCAAAAESRISYLSRLKSTGRPENGWWRKQEPLCADPGTPLAAPESAVLVSASKVEELSLLISSEWSGSVPLPPSVVQSFLWPLHNVLLAIWVLLIFICTHVGSGILLCKTTLLGARATGAPLGRIFSEDIGPASLAAQSLCEPHQAVAVRLTGLCLMPYITQCNACRTVVDRAGPVAGGMAYVFLSVMTWWFWLCMLPWFAFAEICTAVMLGWCFALIELAGV